MARGSNLDKFKFQKGTSGNPKGRPKKFVSKVLDEIKKDGENVTRKMVTEIYQVLMSQTEEQLKTITGHKELPMMYRIIAKELLSKKGFDIIEKMLDRANGKPTQVQEVSGSMDNNIEFVLPLPSEEMLKKWQQAKVYAESED